MCGICGIICSDRSLSPSRDVLTAMRDSMTHRGPDDAGEFLAQGVALGSRRLSILDLSPRGHMPMSTPDGRFTISYNGEVYNFKELRAFAEAKGCTFRSNTDTEVVLQLYALEGPAMLGRLNGIFAFSIWDARDRTMFLVRDRVGVKPLYYAVHNDTFYFASEEKALFAAGVPRRFDETTWEELLCFRYVAGERTPYQGVRRLLPGHYLVWKDGRTTIVRWWHLGEKVWAAQAGPSNPSEWFRTTFDSSTDMERISDVPVGVLLSGGLDSSSVAASLARHAGTGVASFTVRFDEPHYDEGPLAWQVAERWKLDYHDLQVRPDDLVPLLEEASWLNDEPLAHGNDLYLLAIARYAKPHVTVLLSGEGADETMGGYVRYQPLRYPALLRGLQSILQYTPGAGRTNGRIGKLSRFLSLGQLDRFVLYNACDVLPDDLVLLGMAVSRDFSYREQVLGEAQSAYPSDVVRQAMYLDHHTFMSSLLDRNDRMTMGASIECRVPFLDHRLVEGLAAVPSAALFRGMRTKYLLRSAVGDRLPDAILKHRKWGFGVPWSTYFREIPYLREYLLRLHTLAPINDGALDAAKVHKVVMGYLAGDENGGPIVKQLFMISTWYQSVFGSRQGERRSSLQQTGTLTIS